METVIRYLTLFRTLVIQGRYGGGKTALSVHLALRMIEGGYADKICSNVRLTIGEPVATIKPQEVHDLSDVVHILDEAWLMLPSGTSAKQVNDWLAYLRKSNQHIILPSVLPLARQVSHFVMERSYNALPIGLPLWLYRWRLKGGALNKRHDTVMGWCPWWHPTRIFGIYDHLERPTDDYYVYRFTGPQ